MKERPIQPSTSDSPPERATVSRKRQSIINLIAQYSSIVLMIVQGIILTPLYLKYIPSSLFGAWLGTGNILSWISMVDPGISRILQQRTAYTFGRGDMPHLGGVIGTGLLLGFLFSILPLAALPFSGTIVGMLKLSASEHAELTISFKWALVSTSLMIAMFQPAAVNLGLQRSLGAGVAYAVATLAGIVVTFVMLESNFGLISIPVGLVARALIMLLCNAAWMLMWCRTHLRGLMAVRKEELRKYSALSTLTFFERIMSVLVSQSDAFLTAKIVSNDVAVVYSLSGRALDPVRLIAERLLPAFLPGLAHLAGEGNHERLQDIARRLIGIIALVISVGAACVVALNFAFVQLWVGPVFFGGERLTLLFACLAVTNVLFSCLSETVFAVGGVGPVEVMRVVEGFVRIVLQLALLKYLGIIGIPLGGCIGMLLVSGYYLPRLLVAQLGGDLREQYIVLGKNLLRSGVMLACGVAAWYALSHTITAWTWPRFAGVSAVVGALFSAIGFAMSPSSRGELGRVLARASRFWARVSR